MVDVEGLALSDHDRRVLKHSLVHGVILFARNFDSHAQVSDLISEIRSLRTPALIVAVDQEGGRVQRFREAFVRIPPMAFFGVCFDQNPALALQRTQDCGWVMACELRDVGIDLNFAPVLDLNHGCSEVIGDRAFHREPEVVSALANAYMQGLHSGGIAACGKHFPGHGAVREDSHVALPQDMRSREEVQFDLQPFESLIQSNIESLMTAHLITECEDAVPVSFSYRWLVTILRESMGYKGIIFSDDLSMQGAAVEGGIVASVGKAMEAGCQFLPVCNDRPAVLELLSANAGSGVELGEAPDFSALRARFSVRENFRNTMRYNAFVEYLSMQNTA